MDTTSSYKSEMYLNNVLDAYCGIFKAGEEETSCGRDWGRGFPHPIGSRGGGERAAPTARWGVDTPAHSWLRTEARGQRENLPWLRKCSVDCGFWFSPSPHGLCLLWGHGSVRGPRKQSSLRSTLRVRWVWLRGLLPGPGPATALERWERARTGQPALPQGAGRWGRSGLGEGSDPSQRVRS